MSPRSAARRAGLALLGALALAAGLTLPAASAATRPPAPTAAPTLSPLAITALAPPVNPVAGADGKVHLAYELTLANQSGKVVQLTSVSAVDAGRRDAVLSTLSGAALDALLRPSAGERGTALAPGESGYLFLDVALAPGTPLPRTVRHRFAMTLTDGPPPADPGPVGSDAPPAPAATLAFTGVPVPVSAEKAVVVAPPLRGAGWVVGNGCCDAITAHRGATLSINGTVHVAERFAIDFVQLDAQRRLYVGDPAQNASWPFFDDDILSVANGTVVAVQDGLPDEIPGALPAGATIQTAGGNYAVVDIGDGRFAFYAHLQPGSLRVKVGQRVRTGDVLGVLGNSGNTDAPHLHFHLMDGPSPLESDGLPFTFTSFTGEGRVADESTLAPPFPAVAPQVPVDASVNPGAHRRQLPLNLEVIDFG